MTYVIVNISCLDEEDDESEDDDDDLEVEDEDLEVDDEPVDQDYIQMNWHKSDFIDLSLHNLLDFKQYYHVSES